MKRDIDVLLIAPSDAALRSGSRRFMSYFPPLGIGYIAGILRRYGFRALILDLNVDRIDLRDYLKGFDRPPKHIGITSATQTLYSALNIAKICKEAAPHSIVTFGGIHPTAEPEEVLSNLFVDYVVRGEGELTYLELIRGEAKENIHGLSYRYDNFFQHNRPREFIGILDDIPFPAYDLMPMTKYHSSFLFSPKRRSSTIMTSRGCLYRCNFCASQIMWGKKVRVRSVDSVIDEITYLAGQFSVRNIFIADDTFTFSRERVIEFCQALMEKKLKLYWRCFSRAEGLPHDVLKLMKLSGCCQIQFGIESADEQILKLINKDISLEEARAVIALTKKTGIGTFLYFLFGNPGENKSTIDKTIKFALEVNPDYAFFQSTFPYPGTEFSRRAKENGTLEMKKGHKYSKDKYYVRLPGIEKPSIIGNYIKYAFMRFYLRPVYVLPRLMKIIRSIVKMGFYLQAFFYFNKVACGKIF